MKNLQEDKSGNSPEVGGFIVDKQGNSARIVDITVVLIFHGHWYSVDESDSHVSVGCSEISKLISNGFTFEPKPEEPEKPKREIPKDGTPVKVGLDYGLVRISAGNFDSDGRLFCFDGSNFSGPATPWTNWEVI